MLDLLKKTRERCNISLKEVSEELRIREHYLEAIERGDFSHMPELVYCIGFIKSYAKFLGLSSDDMIKEVKEIVSGKVQPTTGDDVSNNGEGNFPQSSWFSNLWPWSNSSKKCKKRQLCAAVSREWNAVSKEAGVVAEEIRESVVGRMVEAVSEKVNAVAEEIRETVVEEAEVVSEKVNAVVEEVREAVAEEIEVVSEKVNAVVEEVREAVAEEIEIVSEKVNAVAKEVREAVAEEIVSEDVNTASKRMSITEEMRKAVSEEVRAVKEEVRKAVSEEVEAVKEEVRKTVSERLNAASEELSAVSKKLDAVSKEFSDES